MLANMLLAQEGGGPWMMPAFLVVMFILAWLILFRPMQRQERERKAMIAALKKNDEVIAAGGIIGTVVNIKEKAGGIAGMEDVITLRVDEKTRIPVLRSSIMRVARIEEAGKEQQAASQ